MKIDKAELLLDTKSDLGEGPVWDYRKKQLYWVDIEGQRLHQIDPSTNEHTDWDFEGMVGAAVPTESGNLLLALEHGLAKFNIETQKLALLGVLENELPEMRYNDGKVGPDGNFYIGSMHKKGTLEMGNLYVVNADLSSQILIPTTTISNGMAWSSDRATFYFVDSHSYNVCAYDFDVSDSSISGRRVVFSIPENLGAPDGMCIDNEGMLWIAHWGGHCVRRWHPNTGEVLEKITVDAPQVTSCCFGGENLDTLYITTARSGMTENQLQEFPLSGGLFTCRSGVTGNPIHYFKDN